MIQDEGNAFKGFYYLVTIGPRIGMRTWPVEKLSRSHWSQGLAHPNLRGTKGWPCRKRGHDRSAGSWGPTPFYMHHSPGYWLMQPLMPSVIIPVANRKTPGQCNGGVSSVLLLLIQPVSDLSFGLSLCDWSLALGISVVTRRLLDTRVLLPIAV